MIEMRFKYFRTEDDGEIISEEFIDDSIIQGTDFDETVGDEFWIKSSDLNIETIGILPFTGSLPPKKHWIAVYINDMLFNVYQHPELKYLSYDKKNNRFKYRLYAIQKIFYDHLDSTVLQYSNTATDWNYNLPSAILAIKEISVKDESGTPLSILNRAGFSFGDMLISLINKHNEYGYVIDGVTHPVLYYPSDDLPILFRGLSKDISESAETKINFTFYEDGGDIFHVTWMDIFKLAIFGFNAFLKVQPRIENDYLSISIFLIPKINADLDGFATTKVQWIERRQVMEKYKLDGISLNGKNFNYSQGDDRGNVLVRSVKVADYDQPIAGEDKTLYWAAGDFDSGVSKYDLVNPYFASGLVNPYYEDMITSGNGWEGKAFINYFIGSTENLLSTLTQVKIGDETVQINTMRFGADGVADVEGIVIVN
jgi:hypothetical protein